MRDRTDDLLDRALRSYVAEPRAGLERRVLTRVRGGRVRWLAALPVFTVAVLACWSLVVRKPVAVEPPRAKEKVEVAHSTRVAGRRQVARKKAALPKLETFPAASPLTAEERALLRISSAGVTGKLGGDWEPLEITPLEIVPLDEGEKQ